MKILRDRFTLAGILCVLLFALDVSVNLGDWWELLWFCPVASLLAALAFFRRNALLLTICLVLAVPAQLPWVWDFLLSLFGLGMGRTEELLRCGPFIFWGSIVVHSAVVPLAAWGVFRLGFDR
ncbi:MAG: hypothetical protein HGA80_08250, partial [Candidatus Omnitrophica bacterium]|nr:hypothetical protein [Candidatus Omnitrophota bacterium]